MRAKMTPFALVLALPLLVSCSGEGESLRETSQVRQCRANMITLSTDQASFATMNGRWATAGELEESAGWSVSLVCPSTGEGYTFEIDLENNSYTISCPQGHGSVNTGQLTWNEGSSTR